MSLPGVVWLVERPRECRPRLTLRLVFVGHAIWPSSHDIPGKRQEEVSEPPSEGAMVETFRMHFSPFRNSSSQSQRLRRNIHQRPPCKDAKTINITLKNCISTYIVGQMATFVEKVKVSMFNFVPNFSKVQS